jgi:regulator of protease activity HflC (stomatin/prohibitin superfamily)
MTWLLAILLALLLIGLAGSRLIGTFTVFEYEQGLKFVHGRLVGLVSPGRHWYLRGTTVFRRVDTRPTHVTVSGQEVLTSDGLAVKVSLLAVYRVLDAKAAVLNIENYAEAVHVQLQLALRAVVAAASAEDLLQKRGELPAQLLALAGPALAPLGLELQVASVRDLTLPGELKKIFAQVVKARQDGLAALEKARGEIAALRGLANAAQLVQQNPQLLQLRLLQVLEQNPGHTVVFGSGDGILPIRSRQGGAPPVPTRPPDESSG